MIILSVALIALPTIAQTYGKAYTGDQQQFKSTSSMQKSGSMYSANPSLNANGTATYSPAKAPNIRRAVKEDPSIDTPEPVVDISDDAKVTAPPVGDAVLPLMLMALAYLGVRVFRARKRA